MTRAYLSLGSNLGDRSANLREAIGKLSNLGTVTNCSSIYEAEPVEFTEQPEFLNCVVELETPLPAESLLDGVLSIEQGMGRDRAAQPAKGPRTIDLDILLFGDAVVQSAVLTLPHPAMHTRHFVLEPLAEITPDLAHPQLHRTIRELRDRLPRGPAVRKLPQL